MELVRQRVSKRQLSGMVFRQAIVQDHVEQRFVYTDLPVVVDEAELAEAIHEKTHPGPGSADHIRQGLLRNLRKQSTWLTRLTEFRHEQEDSCQALFTRIEELINEIGLNAHASFQQEFHEEI